MSDDALEFDSNFLRLEPEAWIDRLAALGDEHGYFQGLGEDHFAVFLDAGPNLLVTFENAQDVRRFQDGAAPRGFAFAKREGWSHLAILSKTQSWFRDPAIYGFFDRLIDEGFLEDFGKVLFHGAGPGGYAACAYSVSAPGTNVLAMRPQATLDPRRTAFDIRYKANRREDFTSRFGFAPDMIDAAGKVYLAFDPYQRLDAIHAAMFTAPHVKHLRCPALGARVDTILGQMGALDEMLRLAMTGDLTDLAFARLFRARRDNVNYRRAFVKLLANGPHKQLTADLCVHLLAEKDDPMIKSCLQDLEKAGVKPREWCHADA